MLTFKRTILILTCFLMAGCIGPFYNPYPLSKLVAKVGPPLKLNTMSVEEQINAEIQAEAKTESGVETRINNPNQVITAGLSSSCNLHFVCCKNLIKSLTKPLI